MSKKKLKVGIIAAEHSGDRLGSKLIESLQNYFDLDLYGLGGPEVTSCGVTTPVGIDYQDLHVMGLIDPLINLPKLLSIRKKLSKLFISNDIISNKATNDHRFSIVDRNLCSNGSFCRSRFIC